jgi:tRNA A-37 threonylcarbamoyl transferase component Bud32
MRQNSTIPAARASLNRKDIAALPRRSLRPGRNGTKAEVSVVEPGETPFVVKDTASRSWAVRTLLGPWQLNREERAYRILAGTPGIPRLIGRPDRQSLALEYIPGRSLDTLHPGEVDGAFFDRLDKLLETMHARGIAHGDLHHRDILLDATGNPFVIDFATSLEAGAGANTLRRMLFKQMMKADLRTAAKLRRRLAPGSARALPPRPLLYRVGVRLKKTFIHSRHSRNH